MDGMIADILEFSRLARVELPAERVVLRTAVEEGVANLTNALEKRMPSLRSRSIPSWPYWATTRPSFKS